MLCKARNVKPILIVPGPHAPKSYSAYWGLILDMFAQASPFGGVSLAPECKCVRGIDFCIVVSLCMHGHLVIQSMAASCIVGAVHMHIIPRK